MNIEEVMNKTVQTCRATDSLRVPAKLMWDHDIGAVAVVDDESQVIGMVTDRDLLMCSYFSGKSVDDEVVSHAMSQQVHTATVGQTVQAAEAMMRSRQVRRLPVVDKAGKLQGVVSVNDLALAAGKGRAVRAEEVTATLASICQPRRAMV